MIRQKLAAVLTSRPFQLAWSAFFFTWAVVFGLLARDPVALAFDWGIAGFMLCNLLYVAAMEHSKRRHKAELQAETERFRAGLNTMVEHAKADLRRWANERGMEVDMEMGTGEPPWTRGGLH